jgi:two-component system nitrogen regulation response regulator GlnG
LKDVAAGQGVGDAAIIHDPGGPGVPGLVVSMAKLLLVEDDEAVRSVLRQAIELADHEVTCVGRHADAKAAMTKERYALLVADARLPDGSGRALAEHAAQSGLKAVLLSGHPDELKSTALGRVHCLQKPFRVEDLLAAIERLLSR